MVDESSRGFLRFLRRRGSSRADRLAPDTIETDRKAFGAVPRKPFRRVASFSDYGCDELGQYPARKRESHLFCRAKMLADIECRHPALSWSDIAIYHPTNDPRTFLPPRRCSPSTSAP